MRLLEEAALSLEECDRSISIVFDRLDLNLPSAHDGQCRSEKL